MLSTEEIAGYKELVELTFVHKYTRAVASAGSENDWNEAPPTYDVTPDVDLPCNYLSSGTVTLRDGSLSNVENPTISIPSTDTLARGDRVTDIKDAAGTIVHTGPLYVDVISPAMGFGIVTNYIATLSGHSPTAL